MHRQQSAKFVTRRRAQECSDFCRIKVKGARIDVGKYRASSNSYDRTGRRKEAEGRGDEPALRAALRPQPATAIERQCPMHNPPPRERCNMRPLRAPVLRLLARGCTAGKRTLARLRPAPLPQWNQIAGADRASGQTQAALQPENSHSIECFRISQTQAQKSDCSRSIPTNAEELKRNAKQPPCERLLRQFLPPSDASSMRNHRKAGRDPPL